MKVFKKYLIVVSGFSIFLSLLLFPIILVGTLYDFSDDPIDVVIPCCSKDLDTLPLCIEHALRYIEGVRRVIVVSSEPLTDKAEWFDEERFPFSKKDIEIALNRKDYKVGNRLGWYFQQLLKLYALRVIPGISSNILVLDSDTIFLRSVSFIGEGGGALFCPSTEHHPPYFRHMKALIGLDKVYASQSGVSHHMLFQKPIMDHLFQTIEELYHCPVWQAFCQCVEKKEIKYSGASEYEIYFNFALSQTKQVSVRPLKFANISTYSDLDSWHGQDYDFISCHKYLRKN